MSEAPRYASAIRCSTPGSRIVAERDIGAISRKQFPTIGRKSCSTNPSRMRIDRALDDLVAGQADFDCSGFELAERIRHRHADHEHEERKDQVGRCPAVPRRMREWPVQVAPRTGVVDQDHTHDRRSAHHIEREQAISRRRCFGHGCCCRLQTTSRRLSSGRSLRSLRTQRVRVGRRAWPSRGCDLRRVARTRADRGPGNSALSFCD